MKSEVSFSAQCHMLFGRPNTVFFWTTGGEYLGQGRRTQHSYCAIVLSCSYTSNSSTRQKLHRYLGKKNTKNRKNYEVQARERH